MEAARRGDGTLRRREERMRNSEVEADGLPKMKYTRALIGCTAPVKSRDYGPTLRQGTLYAQSSSDYKLRV
jgi:hypothetical protein